jgi:hypothetical protein
LEMMMVVTFGNLVAEEDDFLVANHRTRAVR